MPVLITNSTSAGMQATRPADRSTVDAMDRNPWMSFAALSIVYFAAVFALSSLKLLWLDELITLHIARLNSIPAIWHALASGADPNPPLMHIAVMLCRRVFGEHAWALRLPAALGFWTAMVGLFLFLKRRVPVAWALAGTTLTMGMGTFEWAFESRSYAMFYGFAMLAFYFWTITARPDAGTKGRAAATIALVFCLVAGICTNFFAVLAFVPVAAAELTRTILLRKVRWSLWAGIILSGLPLLLFRPMIQKSITLYAPYAWNKVSVQAAIDGYGVMVEYIRFPLGVLMVTSMAVYLLRQLDPLSLSRLRPGWLARLAAHPSHREPLLSLPEAAAVSAFVAYPFLGFALASLRGGMLSPRFVAPVALGSAIASILFAYRTFGYTRKAGSVALILALTWFALRSAHSAYIYSVRKECFDRIMASIPAPDYPNQPLAVSDDLMILPLEFYARRDIAHRIVQPVDFSSIMFNRGEASAEVNLWNGRGTLYNFPVLPLPELQRSTSTYMILTSGREWLVDDLVRHWYEVEPIEIDPHTVDTFDFYSPVAHARPVFFRATGDLYPHPNSELLPFDETLVLPLEEKQVQGQP